MYTECKLAWKMEAKTTMWMMVSSSVEVDYIFHLSIPASDFQVFSV